MLKTPGPVSKMDGENHHSLRASAGTSKSAKKRMKEQRKAAAQPAGSASEQSPVPGVTPAADACIDSTLQDTCSCLMVHRPSSACRKGLPASRQPFSAALHNPAYCTPALLTMPWCTGEDGHAQGAPEPLQSRMSEPDSQEVAPPKMHSNRHRSAYLFALLISSPDLLSCWMSSPCRIHLWPEGR